MLNSSGATPTLWNSMEPTYFAQYRGFEFRCSPERIGDHAFAPRLVIFDATDSIALEIPVHIPTPPYESATAAAHQAFAFGRRWVDGGYRLDDLPEGTEPRVVDDEAPLQLPR
jgi:hypothetical protein